MLRVFKPTLIVFGMVLLAGTLVTGPLAAQTAAVISGVVSDETGAVLPGVTVTIMATETGASRTVVTDGEGRFYAPNLAVGNYEVRAQLSGFKTAIREGITLTVGRHAVVDLRLGVGELSEEVTIVGEASLVDTRSGSVGGLVEQHEIQQLPLSGRSYGELTRLIPGVVRGQGSQNFQGGFTDNISMRGGRVESNKILLDGTDIQGVDNKIPGSVGGLTLGVDAIREFKVEVGTYSAEFGRALGGVINVSTKSGTNRFSGNAFEFHRNDKLDAKNFFDSEKSQFVRNQFGASLGGPLVRDRTHFFGNIEGLTEELGFTSIAIVPTALARQGIIPTPSGGSSSIKIAPAVRPYLDLYPLPNGRDFGDGRAELVQDATQPTDQAFASARVDHRFSQSDSIFVRYTFDHADRVSLGGQDFAFLREPSRSRNQFVTIEEQKIVSSSVFNTFRIGFARNFKTLALAESDQDARAELAFVPGFRVWDAELVVGGLSTLGLADKPRTWATNKFQVSNQLVWRTGAHALKFGVEAIRFHQNIHQNSNNAGEYDFRGLREFLEGRPRRFRSRLPGADQSRGIRTTQLAWYVQDDIALTSALTLNVGLRHDVNTGPTEKHGRCPNVDDIQSPDARLGCPLFPTFWKNFAPRLGFAWDIGGTGKMALRGGAGVFYSELSASSYYTSITNQPPLTQVADVRNPRFPNAYEDILTGQPRLRANPNSFTATPSALQFSLTLQRDLGSKTVGSIGYAGSQGRNWIRRGEENVAQWVILPDGRKFFPEDAPRLSPHWNQILRVVTDVDDASYHGLLTDLRRRFNERFSVQAAYAFSKSIDTAPFVSRENVMDFHDPSRDIGLSDNDVRHNLSVAGTWLLPELSGRGPVEYLFGGWQINGIIQASSGSPFSAHVGFNISRDRMTQILERPDLVPGRSNNPVLGGPDQYFDPRAFALQEPGFYGNVGRNTIIGPGFSTVDISLMKNVGLGGDRRLQVRAEVFNALNRSNFAQPRGTVFLSSGPDPAAGRITRTAGTARQVQLGLKLYF